MSFNKTVSGKVTCHLLKHMDSIAIAGPLSLLSSGERSQFHMAQSKESGYDRI
jgi:hypothetical protein